MFRKFIRFYKPYKKLFILDLLAASLAGCNRFSLSNDDKRNSGQCYKSWGTKVIGVFAVTLIILFLIKAGCDTLCSIKDMLLV